MFKKLIFIFGLLVSANVYAVNWTANIKNVTVYPSGKVAVILENVSSPNPVGSTWGCTSSVVMLGDPAESALISSALAQYTTQKQVRIGVEGADSTCFVSYLSSL